jgi:hypothetical protein
MAGQLAWVPFFVLQLVPLEHGVGTGMVAEFLVGHPSGSAAHETVLGLLYWEVPS